MSQNQYSGPDIIIAMKKIQTREEKKEQQQT